MRKHLREFAESGYTVLIATKGPDGEHYNWYGYADDETEIDFEQGIYGYDTEVEENVYPMSLEDAKATAMSILEEAPAGDLLVGVVPYSTILNESKKTSKKVGKPLKESNQVYLEDILAYLSKFADYELNNEGTYTIHWHQDSRVDSKYSQAVQKLCQQDMEEIYGVSFYKNRSMRPEDAGLRMSLPANVRYQVEIN